MNDVNDYYEKESESNNEPALAQRFPVVDEARIGQPHEEMDEIDEITNTTVITTTSTAYLPNASGQVKDYFKSKWGSRGPNLKVKYNLSLKV